MRISLRPLGYAVIFAASLIAPVITPGTISAESQTLAGSAWLGGSGVNVMAAGDDSKMCVAKDGTPASNGCPVNTVWSGHKWQCVELINRLYLTKGWTTSTWGGDGDELGAPPSPWTFPAGLVKQNNGAISYVNDGDAVSMSNQADIYGHANVVNTMSGTTINLINQNAQLNSSAYINTGSLANGNALFKPNAWAGYAVLSIIHRPGGTGTAPPVNTTPTAIDSQITPDGIQHIYKGTEDGRVWEVAWGNGTLGQQPVASGLGGPVRALASRYFQGPSGWEQHVYAAVGQNVYDIGWGGGSNYGVYPTVSNIGSDVMGISSRNTGTAVHHIYFRAGDKVWERQWGNGANALYTPTPNGGLGTPKKNGLTSQYYNGQNHVYTLSTDGGLREVAWGNGASGVWTPMSGLGGSNSGISSQLINAGGEQHVYAGTDDGKIWAVRWGNSSTYSIWNPASGLGGAVTGVSSSLTEANKENVYASVGQNTWHSQFVGTSTIATVTAGSNIGAPILGVSSKVTAGPSGPTHHAYVTTGSDAWEVGWGGGANYVQQRVGLGMGY